MAQTLLLVSVILAFSISAAFSVKVSPPQQPAMLELRRALDNSSILETWNPSRDCSEWLGVTCDDDGLVVEISLRSEGTYLPDINFFSIEPTNMSLESNDLYGTIPDVIGNLTSLQKLTISGTTSGITGVIPSSITKLTNLILLDLSSNILSGEIPSDIDSLKNLTHLFLSYNILNGSIPPSIGNLTNLVSLDLGGNSLNGTIPSELSKLNKLKLFNVGVNNFNKGGFPEWVSEFKNLKTLDLHVCNLNGSVPNSFSQMKDLDYVDISFNNLTGPLGPQFSKNRNLTGITVKSNSFNGTIYPSWNTFKLTNLDLSSNKFTGIIPESISRIGESLQYLDLAENQLVGSIPPSISNLTSLVILQFPDNNLNGSIPASLSKLVSLNDILLSNNQLTGQIPLALGSLSFMMNLFLDGNQFTGPLPYNFGAFSELFTLIVRNNTFTGQLPPDYSKLSNMEIFDASSNIFTGVIPPSYGKMKSLKYFLLFQNSLYGSIPDLSNLTNLLELDLSLNYLSGPLPNNLSPSLIKLNLRSNQLSGEVPKNFLRRLSNLTTLDLSLNLLTGIPELNSSISNATSIQYISIAGNQFSSSPNIQEAKNANGGIIQIFGDDNCNSIGSICYPKNKTFSSQTLNCNSKCSEYSVSPVLYVNSESCPCSPPLRITVVFYSPLFYVFNGNQSERVEDYFAKISGIDRVQVKVHTAIALVGSQLAFEVTVLFYTQNTNKWSNIQESSLRKELFGSQSKYDPDFPEIGPYRIRSFKFIEDPFERKESSEDESSKNFRTVVIVVVCVAVFVVISALVFAIVFVKFYAGNGRKIGELEAQVAKGMARAFTLAEIQQATQNFSEDNLLGAGGFGSVYKGVSKSGELWAAKRAKKVSLQSKGEFENEVLSISRMDHINLVKLLGYCDEQNEQILIYEYMSKGTLRSALDPKRAGVTRPPLTLEERIHIAVGSASGLNYLHSGATQTIIHRDIKSENILLDAQLNAKVADFGLLKKNAGSEDVEKNTENTKLAGTPGYMDPEYYTTYKVTSKSDVYSFGVVMLELLTGKAPIIEDKSIVRSKYDQDAVSMITVTKWAVPHIEMGKLGDIIDPMLEGNYDYKVVEAFAHVAFACVRKQGAQRPDMAIVVSRLREILEVVRTGGDLTVAHFSVAASDADSSILEPPIQAINDSGVSGFYAPSGISFGR